MKKSMQILDLKLYPKILSCLVLFQLLSPAAIQGQGFLHADGKQIVNGDGENVLLRGIGTGNWMLQEGYMMETSDIAGTQHEFREKLVNSIGEAYVDSFYTVWLENHCTRADIDSLASWGFNSVRVAMHYKWFTLPIEEEPVQGAQTWLNKGFELIDSLLDRCGDNEMYLILDLHGAPGGQGKDANISDYDPSKPSLWESEENRDKTVALWAKLAERYRDEPWMGGYDLINETNWSFPGGNNSPLRSLYMEITDSIRLVDTNHMIIIEGNWFANDFSQLTPPWDANMIYSFHKYWSFNGPNSLDWVINLRNTHEIPIWLGESGENSNTWFRNLIALCESNNIGWSWWPLKKGRINNPLHVKINEDYRQLVDNWKGQGPILSQEEAFQAVLTFADNHRIENCIFQKDVVDAMIRQPHSSEILPYRQHTVGDTVFASDYDMGRNGYAYFDLDTGNYRIDTDEYTEWNRGWSYRNDGVDMQPCEDTLVTNGYNVGWTETNEWLLYTISNDSLASYTMEIRSASGAGGSQIYVEVNGVDATGLVNLPETGGWQKWVTSEIENLILPRGDVKLKIVFKRGGSNLNYFRLFNPVESSTIPFNYVSSGTPDLKNQVFISLNKPVTSGGLISATDFTLTQDGSVMAIDSIRLSEKDSRILVLSCPDYLFANRSLGITYSGNSIMHDDQLLQNFESVKVQNNLARHYEIPYRIQAENFYRNNGLELETCSDAGGGYNTGYADPGDYLDYVLHVKEAGEYAIHFRVATERYNAKLSLQAGSEESGFETLQNITFTGTGGWQNWSTQSTSLFLEEGKYLFRLLVTGNEHNLNWFEFKIPVSVESHPVTDSFGIYPNPASDQTTVVLHTIASDPTEINIMDATGRLVYKNVIFSNRLMIDTSQWHEAIYIVIMKQEDHREVMKLIVSRD